LKEDIEKATDYLVDIYERPEICQLFVGAPEAYADWILSSYSFENLPRYIASDGEVVDIYRILVDHAEDVWDIIVAKCTSRYACATRVEL